MSVDFRNLDTAQVETTLKAARRLMVVGDARDKMLAYMHLSMPDPEALDDVTRSRYEITPVSKILCEIIERMDKGKAKRTCVSIGPQYGKSQIISRAGPAWLSGRNPYRNIMLGAYNDDFARDFGGEVRTIIESPFHQLVFPDHRLRKGGTDKSTLITEQAGQLNFVGVGGSGTGKPADIFIVEDPFRNDADAQSDTYRERVWKWFTAVTFSRLLKNSSVLVVHTRWNTDDLIGRICDPEHPERDKLYAGIADRWDYINIPAVLTDKTDKEIHLAKALGLKLEKQRDPLVVKAFGETKMATLAPERKSWELLAEAKQLDARTFGALYMGQPAPEDGDYFKAKDIMEYGPADLPTNLRHYGASDHALGKEQRNDSSCLGVVGTDERDNLWVLPDLVWRKMESDKTVGEMIRLMKTYTPYMWWMENEHISKSFGPFLRKSMQENNVYTYVDPASVARKDIVLRARSIQGRMQQKKVFLPRYAPWFAEARSQLLKFPYGPKDDFVSFLSLIGQGLAKEFRASPGVDKSINSTRSGSIEWILKNSKERLMRDQRVAGRKGW